MPKTNREIAREFFAAYQQGNADAMCRLLHPQVVFNDWAFQDLTDDAVHAMWRWFCTAQFGRRLERVRVPSFEVTSADGDKENKETVRYRVHYELFRDKAAALQPGAKPDHVVDYSIDAALTFRDGLICAHTDKPVISKLRFAYMVSGFLGVLGVLTGKFDASVREKTAKSLREFRESVLNQPAATKT